MEGVDKNIRSTESALRDVNRLLKLDPTNTELLAQKQRLLAEEIDSTKDRLETLKEADKQAKKQLKSGDLGQEAYDALQREIVETEQKLDSLKNTAGSASSTMLKLSKSSEDLSGKLSKASSAFAPLSAGASALGAAAFATIPATEELRSDLSKLDNNAQEAGVGIDTAREAFEAFTVASDETDSSVEATSNLLQAGFTKSNLQTAVEGLTGAYLRFPDTMKIESLADSLQETLATGQATGQFGELLDRLGIGADNFSEGLEKCATQAEKQDYALQTLADAGLMDTYNGWKQNNAGLVESKQATLEFQQATAQLAETLMPIMTKITEVVTSVINSFNNMSPAGQKAVMAIVGITAVLSPLLSVFSKLFSVVSSVTGVLSTASGPIGAIKTALVGLSGPIMAVVAVIGTLVAAFKHLWDTSEDFRNSIIEIWESIKASFQNFVNGIEERLNALGISFSDITNTISMIWNGFCELLAPVFEGAFGAVATILDTVFGVITGIFDTFAGLFTGNWQQLWDGITGIFSSIWNGIVGIFETIIGVITGIFDTVCGWFGTTWENVWGSIKDFFVNIWNGIKDFFTGIVDGIKQTAINQFTMMKNTITTIFNTVKNVFSSIWNGIKDFVSNTVTNIKDTAVRIFTSMRDGIKNVCGKIADTVKNGFNAAIDFITSLPGKALQWGKDFIGGIIDGIKSMIGKVGDAVKSVADKIRNFLHFSRPDEGPLREYEAWMPDFMEGLAKGIDANVYKVQDALEALSSGMGTTLQANTSSVMLQESTTSRSILDLLGQYMPVLASGQGMSIVLDDGTLVGKLMPRINQGLNQIKVNNGRGRTY